MYEFKIEAPILHAVALLAASKDTRYWLCGVNIRPEGGSALRVSASNGAGVLQARVPVVLPAPPDLDVILPLEFTKALPKKGELRVTIEGQTVTASHALGSNSAKLIDGKFPDLARVRPPADRAGKPAEYDFEMLAVFAKAAKLAGWGKARVTPHGPGAGVIGFEESGQAYGLLMPYDFLHKGARVPSPTLPEWWG